MMSENYFFKLLSGYFSAEINRGANLSHRQKCEEWTRCSDSVSRQKVCFAFVAARGFIFCRKCNDKLANMSGISPV